MCVREILGTWHLESQVPCGHQDLGPQAVLDPGSVVGEPNILLSMSWTGPGESPRAPGSGSLRRLGVWVCRRSRVCSAPTSRVYQGRELHGWAEASLSLMLVQLRHLA